jgi:hypothetical protein
MSTKQLSTSALIEKLSNNEGFGPLSQLFIIEAIRYYSERIIENGEPTDNGKTLINPIAWYNIAKEMNSSIESNYTSAAI